MNPKNKIAFYGKIAWTYTKYQILTKTLLLLVIFPLFKTVSDYLISSTGRVGISSGDYLGFLFSIQGAGLLLLSLVTLTILIGIDIHAFILMSALIQESRIKLRATHLLIVGIKSLKSFLHPSAILVMIYVAVVVPLVGIGFGISATENFKIPNFITDVIFNNPLYLSAYVIAMIVLTAITVIHIFFFHYLILDNQNVMEALKNSSKLMKAHWREFIKEFVIKLGILYLIVIGGIEVLSYALFQAADSIDDILLTRIAYLFISLSISEIWGYSAIMILPITTQRLTGLFYRFNQQEGREITLKMEIKAEKFGKDFFKKVRLRTKFAVTLFFLLVMGFNFILSAFLGVFFDELFRTNKDIEIVAHRGGGDLAAENSLLGLERAISEGASWSEIDVQRTKDGYYIIHHDPTFARLCKVKKSSTQMNLEEIRELRARDLFNPNEAPQPISTLEEFLEASKGRIGLFIELKGRSADRKMADDVIKMVKDRKMEEEIAVLSLDYPLISYVEEKYPEIDTGFLYFFAMGDTKNLNADILIMEEREATPDKIEEIHKVGKKAVVWTVNTDSSIEHFVTSEVDAIITDYVTKVKQGMKERDERDDIQIILDSILE